MYPIWTLPSGKEIVLYTFVNNIGIFGTMAVVFVYFLCRGKIDCNLVSYWQEKAEPLRAKNRFYHFLFSRWFWVFLNASVYLSFCPTFSIVNLVDGLFPFLSDSRYFTHMNYFSALFFGLIPVLFLMFLLGVDIRKSVDLLVPFRFSWLALGKLACFFAGCCYGFQWDKGFYNYSTGKVEFPVQLLEVFISLVLCGVMFYLMSRKKIDGLGYPIYMILYSVTRFFTEFLRADTEAIWAGLKPFQWLCIIATVIGAVWIIISVALYKKGKRILEGTDLLSYIREQYRKKKSKV